MFLVKSPLWSVVKDKMTRESLTLIHKKPKEVKDISSLYTTKVSTPRLVELVCYID